MYSFTKSQSHTLPCAIFDIIKSDNRQSLAFSNAALVLADGTTNRLPNTLSGAVSSVGSACLITVLTSVTEFCISVELKLLKSILSVIFAILL